MLQHQKQRVLEAETAAAMRGLLEQVVESGTGRQAAVDRSKSAAKLGLQKLEKVHPTAGLVDMSPIYLAET